MDKTRWNSAKVFLVVLLSAALLLPAGATAQMKAPTQMDKTKVQQPMKPAVRQLSKACDGPDPAVVSLNVNTSASGGKGILNINAVVKNVGTEDFVSKPTQQAVTIQVHDPSRSGPASYETKANQTFGRLNKGATLNVTARHEIPLFLEWGHRNANSGECQAELEVIVFLNYDPDITMDGNEQNDDCNANNNRKKRIMKYMVQCPW